VPCPDALFSFPAAAERRHTATIATKRICLGVVMRNWMRILAIASNGSPKIRSPQALAFFGIWLFLLSADCGASERWAATFPPE
jgi:hypothetical protein